MTYDPTASESNLVDDEEFSDDFSAEDGEGRYVVPDGEHEATCTGVESTTSKAGKPMYVWTWLVVTSTGKEVEIKDYTVRTPSALWKLFAVLAALGVAKPGEKASFKRSQVVGRRVLVTTKKEEYNGRFSSKIDSHKAHPNGAVAPKKDVLA